MRPTTHPTRPLADVLQGTSRGNAKVPAIVERLRLWGINHLYVIGGNGGNAAAHAIAKECTDQGVACNVVGVPKSIDNDIQLVREGGQVVRGGLQCLTGGCWLDPLAADELEQPSVQASPTAVPPPSFTHTNKLVSSPHMPPTRPPCPTATTAAAADRPLLRV